jgi:hypothetical protein
LGQRAAAGAVLSDHAHDHVDVDVDVDVDGVVLGDGAVAGDGIALGVVVENVDVSVNAHDAGRVAVADAVNGRVNDHHCVDVRTKSLSATAPWPATASCSASWPATLTWASVVAAVVVVAVYVDAHKA